MKQLASFMIALTLTTVPVGLSGYHSAAAQEADKEKPQKPKTRRSEVLGKNAFNRIEKAQEMMAEENYPEALEQLQAILDGGDRYKPYEKAVAIQTMGYVFAAQGDFGKTISTFERALETGNLPPRVANDLTYNLAQLNLAEDRPEKALQLLTQWLAAIEGDPAAEAFALKAQTHLMLDQFGDAEKEIRVALSKV